MKPRYALVLACIAACGQDRPADAPPAGQATRAPASPADAALAAFGDLRANRSVAEWRATHPQDSISLYTTLPLGERNEHGVDQWCARADGELPLDSTSTTRRIAYFFPPTPPQSLELPAETDGMVEQCRLGLIWLESSHADSVRADSVSARIQQTLATTLGARDTVTKPSWAGIADWRRTQRWKTGDLEILSASARPQRTDGNRSPAAARALIIALSPASGRSFEFVAWGPGSDSYAQSRAQHDGAQAVIEQAVAIAGIGGSVESRLRGFLSTLQDSIVSQRFASLSEKRSIAAGIGEWLDAGLPLTPERRAAALIAADVLLSDLAHFLQIGDPADSALRAPYVRRGAQFNYSQLGGVDVYTRSWLRQALDLDPNGRAGQIAFLELMKVGFETSGTCTDQGGKGFRAVIDRGESYMKLRPGSPILADVHFLVGQAYSDIVTLANGGGYDSSETAAYVPEAARARTRAIEEFGAAFSLGSSRKSADAWVHAWRLIAGIPPTRTFFYCVYD